MDPPALTFLGATGTVTGSRFLIETADARLLVDCGLYQGRKDLRLRNWEPFPIAESSIDAVVLTHAHVDHCGYLPLLVRNGFAGRVFATASTAALADIVLPDSGHLQEEEAATANRLGFSKHRPALPLYTEDDARRAARTVSPVPFDEPFEAAPGVRLTLRPAGHILGSATVTVEFDRADAAPVVFSGDLGRPEHPLLRPPAPIPGAVGTIVVESTYGNRAHDDAGALERFGAAIARTVKRGGTVVIPAFAVDRTEVVLFHLSRLLVEGIIPEVPVYVDSPMALAARQVYEDALRDGAPDLRDDLPPDPFGAGNVVEVRDPRESARLDEQAYPSIVVSASGMATGGRVLHHLARRLPDSRNTVLLVGFQAEGTRGRRLLAGERVVKMLGRYVPVRAEVVDFTALSVHADRDELVAWLAGAEGEPDATYLVHGEPEAAAALADAVANRLGRVAVAPSYRERVRLA